MRHARTGGQDRTSTASSKLLAFALREATPNAVRDVMVHRMAMTFSNDGTEAADSFGCPGLRCVSAIGTEREEQLRILVTARGSLEPCEVH